ncbi:Trm112 family protein [Arsenicitalea aurantiaca]|nr:Trm112 family protein [Arsenicitalea aurantiaca]
MSEDEPGGPAAAAPAGKPEPRVKVDPRTLEMLVCPLTKTRLTLTAGGEELVSTVARLAFPIRRGVPVLSLDEARPLSDEELVAAVPELRGRRD